MVCGNMCTLVESVDRTLPGLQERVVEEIKNWIKAHDICMARNKEESVLMSL